jgi:hypothetical protein
LPYLAELSFLERDYEQVRKLFIEMQYDPSVSSQPQLHRYWRHGRRTIANRPEPFNPASAARPTEAADECSRPPPVAGDASYQRRAKDCDVMLLLEGPSRT